MRKLAPPKPREAGRIMIAYFLITFPMNRASDSFDAILMKYIPGLSCDVLISKTSPAKRSG